MTTELKEDTIVQPDDISSTRPTNENSTPKKMKKCKAPVEVFSRVTGFYRPVQQWNKGKVQEYHDRRGITKYKGKNING